MTTAIAPRRAENSDFESHDLAPQRTATVEVAASRAAQEVQAAMAVAKRFPRDTISAYNRIMQSCRRKGLAKEAMYEYPRGGEKITGPSIRLAESLAQNWGNVDFGIVELEQRDGESTVMAYAWDLETNTRQTKIFQVRHERHTRKGSYDLTDPRDIYELVANQGARRLRACILGIIPGDIVDAAVGECEKTLSNANGDGPLVDRVRAMISAFADLQVTQPMIEKLLMHNAATISERELIRLRKIYASIRDGMSDRESHFDITAGNATSGSQVEARMQRPETPASAEEANRILEQQAAQVRQQASNAADPTDSQAEGQPPLSGGGAGGGEEGQQEHPSKSAADGKRDWDEFTALCADARIEGQPELKQSQFSRAWLAAIKKYGNKPWEMPQAERDALLAAIVERRGAFAV